MQLNLQTVLKEIQEMPKKSDLLAGIDILQNYLELIEINLPITHQLHSEWKQAEESLISHLKAMVDTGRFIAQEDLLKLLDLMQQTTEEIQDTNVLLHYFAVNKNIASTLCQILTNLSNIFNEDHLKRTLGVHAYHFMAVLGEIHKLQNKFVAIQPFVGGLPRILFEIHRQNPHDVAKYLLSIFQRSVDSNTLSEYAKAIHLLTRCLQILKPRLAVLKALVYDYDRIYNQESIEEAQARMKLLEQFVWSMDRVPALRMYGWPMVATEWRTRKRLWPDEDLVGKIIKDGCHIVPKPYKGPEGNTDLDYRWSFSKPERTLAMARSKEMALSYLIFKAIFYKYFKPIKVEEACLPSYLAKTVMLYESENHEVQWWERMNVEDCVISLIERFRNSLLNWFLPHYFIHDINLLADIPEELILHAIAIAESICGDPSTCILETVKILLSLKGKMRGCEKEKHEVGNNKQNTTRSTTNKGNMTASISDFETADDIDIEFQPNVSKETTTHVQAEGSVEDNSQTMLKDTGINKSNTTTNPRPIAPLEPPDQVHMADNPSQLKENTESEMASGKKNFTSRTSKTIDTKSHNLSSEDHQASELETENMPIIIAKFRKCVKQREEASKDIPEKQGFIELLYKALEFLKVLKPKETELADNIIISDAEELGTLQVTMPIATENDIYARFVNVISFEYRVGKNFRLGIDLVL